MKRKIANSTIMSRERIQSRDVSACSVEPEESRSAVRIVLLDMEGQQTAEITLSVPAAHILAGLIEEAVAARTGSVDQE